VWKYGAGSWVQIADSSTRAVYSASIASDGSIHGVDANGYYVVYSGSGYTWNQQGSSNNYYQVEAKTSSSDVVVVSTNYPYQDFYLNSGSLSQFSTTKSWLSIYGGNIIGTGTYFPLY
jgi:hypothetical protein